MKREFCPGWLSKMDETIYTEFEKFTGPRIGAPRTFVVDI